MNKTPKKKCAHCLGSGRVINGKKMGEMLRAERKRAGLRMSAVCRRAHIHPTTLTRIEKDGEYLTPERVARIRLAVSFLAKQKARKGAK